MRMRCGRKVHGVENVCGGMAMDAWSASRSKCSVDSSSSRRKVGEVNWQRYALPIDFSKLQPILRMYKAAGLLFPSRGNVRKRPVASAIRLLLVAALQLYLIVSSGAQMYISTMSVGHVPGGVASVQGSINLAVAVMLIQTIVGILFVASWQWNGQIYDILLSIQKATNIEGCIKNKKWIYLHTAIHLLLLAMTVAVIALELATITRVNSEMKLSIKIIRQETGDIKIQLDVITDRFWIYFLYVAYLIAMFFWFTINFFYSLLCSCVYLEFYTANEQWKEHVKCLSHLTYFRRAVDKYCKLQSLVAKLEGTVSTFMFAMLLTNGPMAVTTLFVMLNPRCEDDYMGTQMNVTVAKIATGVFLFNHVYQMMCLTLYPAKINEQVPVISDLINSTEAIWQSSDEQLRTESHSFCARVAQSAPYLTAAKCVQVSRSFVVSMASLVVTYTVILLEFQPDGHYCDGGPGPAAYTPTPFDNMLPNASALFALHDD